MARPESRYVCQSCGASTLRWEGQCRDCGAWNTLVETLVRPTTGVSARRRVIAAGAIEAPARHALASIQSGAARRMPAGIGEVDRVLGGGFVPGSLVLLGGEPGIGKSTLVMETAAGVATSGEDVTAATVLYASGEESAGQLHLRAERLGLDVAPAGQRIEVLATTEVDAILAAVLDRTPDLLVVDSVQTLTVDGMEGPPGSVGQVRESTSRLGAFAREEGVPVILVGHVTKDGTLAGPKTLEHLVDVVLMLEGDRYGPMRLLRATKNRFGSTDEVGVLEMTGSGLREVLDPARAFLGDSAREAPGVAVAATLEGSRPLLIEVQALVAGASGYGMPRRTVAGVDANRVALLVAVLARRAGTNLANQDLYVSLAGGASAAEPAIDLALALALVSSFRDRPVTLATVACGEVSLLGELRPVRGVERRLREAARLGFRRAIVPLERSGETAQVPGLEVVAVATLADAIAAALAAPVSAGAGTSGEG